MEVALQCIPRRAGKTPAGQDGSSFGPSAEVGDVPEAIHLNRLQGHHPPGAEGCERWELEADPRHVEIRVSVPDGTGRRK